VISLGGDAAFFNSMEISLRDSLVDILRVELDTSTLEAVCAKQLTVSPKKPEPRCPEIIRGAGFG